MIIITGALGFIGFNLLRELNSQGIDRIIIVENIKNTKSLDVKLERLKKAKFYDLVDREDVKWEDLLSKDVKCVFHLGACTDTTERNFNYLFKNNYLFSKSLIEIAESKGIRVIYASSASVYGNKNQPVDENSPLDPLNYYAYSKFLIDNYVIKSRKKNVVGLRFFNVYGPFEENKGKMSSVIFKFYHQLKKEGKVYLFEGSQNFKRDFIFVEDIVKICLFFMQNSFDGIYNCGTGKSISFVEIANIMIERMGFGKIEFIPFPEELKNQYQEFTQAENSKLKEILKIEFTPIKKGIEKYLEYLSSKY